MKQSHSVTATKIHHDGTGLVTMCISQPLPLRPELPISIHETPATLIFYDFPHVEIMLEDVEVNLPKEAILRQEQATAEPQGVADALTAFWNQYWRRDSKNEQASLQPWKDFQSLMNQLPPLPQATIHTIEIPDWRNSIKSLKSQSSRGICGWYADELRYIAKFDQQLADLASVLNNLNHFPSWLMQARIIPVQKYAGANTASAIRPITVLAMIYRLWARTTSRRMLQCWAQHWPSGVTGFLPHRSPEHLVYFLQHALEKIHLGFDTSCLGGVTLDLVKAFNQLPHQPCKALLLRLGTPEPWVNIWFRSITSMCRMWHVGGSLHSGGLGTTGFPEGDPWSVNAMLSINRLWVHLLEDVHIIANSYADNWAYASYCPNSHSQAVQQTMRLTAAIKVQIDWKKTWAWGTNEEQVSALKNVCSFHMPQFVELQMVPHARELGYILHYRRRQYRGTQQERHEQALKRLARLAKADLPVDVAGLIAQQAGLHKALFGVHIYVPGQKFFTDLRTAIAKVLVPGKNTNPFLALTTVTPRIQDPEVFAIMQAIKSAHRFLHHVSAEEQQTFFQIAAMAPKLANQITGPAQALRHYVQRLGWQIDRAGMLHIDGFLKLSLMWADQTQLILSVHKAWMENLTHELTRKNWRNAPQIDPHATLMCLRKFSDQDRKILAREMIGSFHTQEQKSKFDDHTDVSCLLCGMQDSLEHRIFECSSTSAVLDKFPEVVQFLLEHDPILYHLPMIFEEQHHELHRFLHHQQVPVSGKIHPLQTRNSADTTQMDLACSLICQDKGGQPTA